MFTHDVASIVKMVREFLCPYCFLEFLMMAKTRNTMTKTPTIGHTPYPPIMPDPSFMLFCICVSELFRCVDVPADSSTFEIALAGDNTRHAPFAGVAQRFVKPLAFEQQFLHQPSELGWREFARRSRDQPFEERDAVRKRQLIRGIYEISEDGVVQALSLRTRRHSGLGGGYAISRLRNRSA